MCYFNIPVFLEINVWLTCHFHTFSLCCCRAVTAELRVLLGNTEVYLGGCIRQSGRLQFQRLEITQQTYGMSPGLCVHLLTQQILMEHLVSAERVGVVASETICLVTVQE